MLELAKTIIQDSIELQKRISADVASVEEKQMLQDIVAKRA